MPKICVKHGNYGIVPLGNGELKIKKKRFFDVFL